MTTHVGLQLLLSFLEPPSIQTFWGREGILQNFPWSTHTQHDNHYILKILETIIKYKINFKIIIILSLSKEFSSDRVII
jgi:hypothetical protein